MEGYEVLNIYPAMTEEEVAQKSEEDKKYCIEYVRERRDSTSKERLELIWLTLTSRGEEKLMYGPMPDLYGDMANLCNKQEKNDGQGRTGKAISRH